MRSATAEHVRGDCLESATLRASSATKLFAGGAARRSPASTSKVLGRNTGGEPSPLRGDASPHVGEKQHHASVTTVISTVIALARAQLLPIIGHPAFAVLSEAQGEIASQAAKDA